jgi:hypothetical protein
MACLSMPSLTCSEEWEEPTPRQLGSLQRYVSIKARRSGARKVDRIINPLLHFVDPSKGYYHE